MILNGPPTYRYRLWAWALTRVGHAMLLWRPPRVTGEQLDLVNDTAQPGDVLVRDMLSSIAHFVIPGKRWIHSGVVMGPRLMVHAIANGVRCGSITGFGQIQDRVGVFRPEYPSEEARRKAVEQAKQLVGRSYDFLFRNGDRRLYCHELTWVCQKAAGIAVPPQGRFIIADDVLACPGRMVLEVPGPCLELKHDDDP